MTKKNPELYATPRKIAEYANMAQLFGHEGLLDKLERKTSNNPNARFSYEKIHPELVGRLTEKIQKRNSKKRRRKIIKRYYCNKKCNSIFCAINITKIF